MYKTSYGEEILEVTPSNESYFNRERIVYEKLLCDNYSINDELFIKIKTFGGNISNSIIDNLLKSYCFIGNSVKFEYNSEGKKTGNVVLAFSDKVNKSQAFKFLNTCNISSISSSISDIEVYNSTLSEYEIFCSSSANINIIDKINFLMSSDKITRSILVKGIPMSISTENLLKTLHFLNISKNNLIRPEYLIGSFGCCIIEFDNDEIALEASDLISDEFFIFENNISSVLKVESMLSIINKKQ